jgi:hypothetical protein
MNLKGGMLATCAAAAAAVVVASSACAALAPGFEPSRLVLLRIEGHETPELVLAQRVIEREWGRSDDSIYVEKDVVNWCSEPGAMMMSAVVPGAGQAYANAPGRGLWFALAEALGWTAHILLRNSGEQVREQAAVFAGQPADSASSWSFARWASATNMSPAQLKLLYAADPDVFYDLIGSDPLLIAGWDDGETSRAQFAELRATSDRRLHGARFSASVLWVNHLVAAVDALRAARAHNVRLSPSLGLDVRGGWHRGRPELMAAVVRRF